MNYPSYNQNSAQYTGQTTNRLPTSAYHNSSRVPQSILYQPSPSPKKSNRLYNEDLIQLIAKIRSLEDDLINERFKNQTLQRKISQYEKVIDNLQYELNRQSYQLQKYVHQIELSNQKNIEILKYEQNLKIVGEEIQQLNDILTKRNQDYEMACAENKQIVEEINKLIEESNISQIRQNIWVKEIDAILDENKQWIADDNKGNKNMSVGNSKVSYRNMSPPKNSTYMQSPNNQYGQSPTTIHHDSFRQQQNESVTFDMTSPPSPDIINKKIEQLKTLFSTLSQQIGSIKRQQEETCSKLQQQLMTEKEKYIKLQYEHKLLTQRTKDNDKKKDIVSTVCYNQQQVESTIEEMLKKEDQYIETIQKLTTENEQLNQQLTTMQADHEYIQQINSEEKQSIINSLKKENQLLERTIAEMERRVNDLGENIRQLEEEYSRLAEQKEQHTQQHNQQNMKLTKRMRKLQEENYHYQITIEQLNGEITLLKKQLDLNQNEEQQQ